MTSFSVAIIGGGLAGSEAALTLAKHDVQVTLYEMRPVVNTEVHHTDKCAELVCSNSLKSTKEDSAAGMLKKELELLHSNVYEAALRHRVPAGGALAVDREKFSVDITDQIQKSPNISLVHEEITDIDELAQSYDAVILATGPLTSDKLSNSLISLTGCESLAFYDAAAPIVMADSLDYSQLFRQSRYEDPANEQGDYLNAPFTKEEYDEFIDELLRAKRVIAKSFETKELFQACQPIEEIARSGHDAPRFGTLKPVGLTDPRTGKRPWAALQLRAEDSYGSSYNLVGFQTNLTFPEQKRVFSLIPGLEHAEFARFGVMHRNTFINAPQLLDDHLRLKNEQARTLPCPLYIAGQVSGTEGYCEAIRSGLHAALAVVADLHHISFPKLPTETVFGSLLTYATNPETTNYQPMHVNFGIMPPLETRIRNKKERYAAYANRGNQALVEYCKELQALNLLPS